MFKSGSRNKKRERGIELFVIIHMNNVSVSSERGWTIKLHTSWQGPQWSVWDARLWGIATRSAECHASTPMQQCADTSRMNCWIRQVSTGCLVSICVAFTAVIVIVKNLQNYSLLNPETILPKMCYLHVSECLSPPLLFKDRILIIIVKALVTNPQVILVLPYILCIDLKIKYSAWKENDWNLTLFLS